MSARRRRVTPVQSLARQGSAEQLWELADWFALRGDRRAEEEYRAAARLRERLDQR